MINRRLSCLCLSLSIVCLLLSPVRGEQPSTSAAAKRPSAEASPADAYDFDSAGVRIHYMMRGEGEPVLLIHGFTSSGVMNWQRPGIFDRLAENYRVIAIDNRGHGKSDKPHDAAQYGLQMVEDQVRLLDHLHIRRAHVVGYSMGGFITLRLVVDHPDRLLSATVGGAGWEDPKSDRLAFLNELADSLAARKGIGPLLKYLTPEGAPPLSEQQIKLANGVVMATNDPLALSGVIRGLKGLSIPRQKLAATKVPMMAIVGDRDPMKKGVDALAEIVPSARIVVVPGANHMTTVRNPKFVESLTSFLAEHSQRLPDKQPAAAGGR